MDGLSKLFDLMEAQETRLIGIAHCIVPKEEIQAVESLLISPLIPMLQETITDSESSKSQPGKIN